MDMWEVACVAGAREKKWAQEKTRAREALGKKNGRKKNAREGDTRVSLAPVFSWAHFFSWRLPRARFFLRPFFFL